MTKITVDATIAAKLRSGLESIEVCDETGRTLGWFQPKAEQILAAMSPFSLEELEELRKQKTGRPLADILHDLESQSP